MKFALIILKAISALAGLLPYRASNKIQGVCDALAVATGAITDKDARAEAQRVYDEIEKDVKVAQAKRAEKVKP